MPQPPLILVAPGTQKKGVEFSDFSLNLSECYTRALIEAGAVPCLLSCTPSVDYIRASLARSDGVMLTGGEDVQPSLYARDLTDDLRATSTVHEPERDAFELLLVREVFAARQPLLAICRGHQMVNVALGGTLFVDLPLQRPDGVAHRRTDQRNHPVHEARLAPGSLLERVFGPGAIQVNSTHHQAVDRVADVFQVTATSPDGVIEAMELAPGAQGRLPWFLSVQFHPERLCVNYPPFRRLFRVFVEACAAKAQNEC